MYTIDNLLNSQYLLSKIDISVLNKMPTKELAKDPLCTSIISNKLDMKAHSLINAIDIAMSLAIPKAKLSSKSVLGFDEECKKM